MDAGLKKAELDASSRIETAVKCHSSFRIVGYEQSFAQRHGVPPAASRYKKGMSRREKKEHARLDNFN